MSWNKPRPKSRAVIALFISLGLLGASIGFYFWSQSYLASAKTSLTAHQEALETNLEEAAQDESEKQKQKQSAQSVLDDLYETRGFVRVADGVYAHIFDPEDYSCGYSSCAFIQFEVEKACPNHLFVEIAWEDQGVIVGSTNDMSPALAPGDQWLAEFEDRHNLASSFRLTKVSCQ